MGFGMVFTFSPVWIGELARPELRGFFLCLQNGSIVVGQFVMVYVPLLSVSNAVSSVGALIKSPANGATKH